MENSARRKVAAEIMTAADVRDEYDLIHLAMQNEFILEKFVLMSIIDDGLVPSFTPNLLARTIAVICDTLGAAVMDNRTVNASVPKPVAKTIANIAMFIDRTDCFDGAAATLAGQGCKKTAIFERIDAAMTGGRFGPGMDARYFFGGGRGKWSPAVAKTVADAIRPLIDAVLAKAVKKKQKQIYAKTKSGKIAPFGFSGNKGEMKWSG